ncbi:hypothetical protein [Photobacterium sp. Hal280]|uniref:hypothetical protein n=1 Tax=Photobacterium sp. Hal280 TaxID=3035163 RepID=UPI00301E3078
MKKIPPISDENKQRDSINVFTLPIEDIEIWEVLTHKQYLPNTLLAFKNDWNNFLQYCLDKHAIPLPATVKTVHQFIDTMAKKRKLASLKRYIVTIGLVHRCHALPDPCRHTEVRLVLNKYCVEKKTTTRMRTPLGMITCNSWSTLSLSLPNPKTFVIWQFGLLCLKPC